MIISTIRDTITGPRPDLFLGPCLPAGMAVDGAELALVRVKVPFRSGIIVWVAVIAVARGAATVAQIGDGKNLLSYALN